MTGILEPLAGTAPAVWESLDDRFAGIRGDKLLERLWTGGRWVEGPVYSPAGRYLLWSDIPNDRILRWDETSYQVSVFRQPAGNTNGHTLDTEGRLVSCEHGNRRVTRTEHHGGLSVLASEYDGKRLNSPNDLVVKSDGAIYFTETTSGIRGRDEGPARELSYHGVYLIKDATLRLLDKDPQGAAPNGIAFSPDEKILYVNGGTKITAYEVREDDTVANPRVLIDLGGANGVPGNTDGMKVDRSGNIYVSGPGGVWIISPQGKHLGTIVTPERVANLAFGDADSKTVYMVGGRSLWRISVNTAGIRPMTRRNE